MTDYFLKSFPRRIFCAFVLGGLGILLIEASVLGLYHEEPTRVLVAVSMLSRGEWFVPNLLGELYLKKPPGYNWFIALVSLPFGEVTKFSARSTAVLSWLGLGGLAGLIGARLKKRTGFYWVPALAAWFNLTIFLEKAALAEIDLFFTLLLFAGLVLFYSFREDRRPWLAWLGSHGFLVLAVLTKGPVAYLFFYLPIIVFLNWDREPVHWSPCLTSILLVHSLLLIGSLIVLGGISGETLFRLVVSEVFNRGAMGGLASYILGLIKYPLVLIGSFLPWGLVFFALFRAKWRKAVLNLQLSRMKFIVAALSPLIVLWLFPARKVRYALPLFPWLAILVGEIFDRLAQRAAFANFLRKMTIGLSTLLVVMISTPLWFKSTAVIGTGYQLLVAGLIGIIGLGGLSFSLRTRTSVRSAFVLFLIFIFALKVGHLSIYLPSVEPQRFLNESIILKSGKKLREAGYRSVSYRLDRMLEVPYYFHRLGFDVTVNTTAGRNDSSDLYVISSTAPDTKTILVIKLNSGPKLTVKRNVSS